MEIRLAKDSNYLGYRVWNITSDEFATAERVDSALNFSPPSLAPPGASCPGHTLRRRRCRTLGRLISCTFFGPPGDSVTMTILFGCKFRLGNFDWFLCLLLIFFSYSVLWCQKPGGNKIKEENKKIYDHHISR